MTGRLPTDPLGFDRLHTAVEAGTEPGTPASLHASGLRYREFALANPHFYAIMFEDAIPHESRSQEVGEHAMAAFGALVRLVELAAAGRLRAPGVPGFTGWRRGRVASTAVPGRVSLDLGRPQVWTAWYSPQLA